MRIALNGMGRIGRLLFRRLVCDSDFEITAVNDIMDAENLAYLLRYDTIYGAFQEPVRYYDGYLLVNERKIKVFRTDDPALIDWEGVDVVLECSGKFANKMGAGKHLAAGAKSVLLSTTGSDDIPLMIYGHNHASVDKKERIVSPGGCMTNCATHILYILNSIGIESAQLTILHSYTSRQELVDTAHKEFRRGRAAAESIIPAGIDLEHALGRVLPVGDAISALSIRVPVPNGAMMDCTVQLKTAVSRETINLLFQNAARQEYRGIIDYTEDPIVSADIKGNVHSCIIDGTLTSVVGRQVKVIAWFDNEYGYTSRIIDWLKYWKRER
jgi:glyceraldehyde 3-phosphate dehydrogenase